MTSPETPSPAPAEAPHTPPSQDTPLGSTGRIVAGTPLLVCAGLLAGALAWLLIARYGDPFTASIEGATQPGAGGALLPPPEEVLQFAAAKRGADFRNHAFSIGLLAASVAGVLGLAEGIARRSFGAAALAALAGAVAGAVLGALGGLAATFAGEQIGSIRALEPYRTIMMHATAWLFAAGAAGIAVALPARRMRTVLRSIAAAAVAALLAAALYSPVAAVLFRLENADLLVPQGSLSLLSWTTLFGVLTGLAIARTR